MIQVHVVGASFVHYYFTQGAEEKMCRTLMPPDVKPCVCDCGYYQIVWEAK